MNQERKMRERERSKYVMFGGRLQIVTPQFLREILGLRGDNDSLIGNIAFVSDQNRGDLRSLFDSKNLFVDIGNGVETASRDQGEHQDESLTYYEIKGRK